MYLFGFGSLINIKSAQKSFKRVLKQEDLIPVTAKGVKKVWNSIEFIDFEDKANVNGVFLNLEIDESSSANGVVVKVSDEEFELLKLREKNYSSVIIKKQNIIGCNLDDDVIAFMTTNESKIAKQGDENCYIPSRYLDLLTQSFKFYDDAFVEKYKEETLKDFPFELKEGSYKFSDPLQNKLAKEGVNESK